MTLKEQINHDLKNAMRARDQKKLDALRLITAAIKQIEVDERIDVNDERLLVILSKLAKQRHESITQFAAAGRSDLVDQEQFELSLINHYLPQPLSNEEIIAMIEAAIASAHATQMSDMGKVMAQLKTPMQGRADMSKVSALIKERLSTSS